MSLRVTMFHCVSLCFTVFHLFSYLNSYRKVRLLSSVLMLFLLFEAPFAGLRLPREGRGAAPGAIHLDVAP